MSREIPTGGMVYAPPVVFPVEGLVVVGSQDGKIYAIDAETKDVAVYAIDAKTEEVVESPEKPKKPLSPIFAPLYADPVKWNSLLPFSEWDSHTLCIRVVNQRSPLELPDGQDQVIEALPWES